jgi:hypothetical protein
MPTLRGTFCCVSSASPCFVHVHAAVSACVWAICLWNGPLCRAYFPHADRLVYAACSGVLSCESQRNGVCCITAAPNPTCASGLCLGGGLGRCIQHDYILSAGCRQLWHIRGVLLCAGHVSTSGCGVILRCRLSACSDQVHAHQASMSSCFVEFDSGKLAGHVLCGYATPSVS